MKDTTIKAWLNKPGVIDSFTSIILNAYKLPVQAPQFVIAESIEKRHDNVDKFLGLFLFIPEGEVYNTDIAMALSMHHIHFSPTRATKLLKAKGCEAIRNSGKREFRGAMLRN